MLTLPTGWWRDRQAAMSRFVEELGDHVALTGDEVTVVLDARPFPIDVDEVDVRFAPPGRDAADDVIVELVARDPEPSTVGVATSDKKLAARVGERGAATISAGSLQRELDELKP